MEQLLQGNTTCTLNEQIQYFKDSFTDLDGNWSIRVKEMLEMESNKVETLTKRQEELTIEMPQLIQRAMTKSKQVLLDLETLPKDIDTLDTGIQSHQQHLNQLMEILHPIAARLLIVDRQRTFLSLLCTIETQSKHLRDSIQDSDSCLDGLTAYQALQRVSVDEFPFLSDLLAQRLTFLSQSLRQQGERKLKETLEDINWPHKPENDEFSHVSEAMDQLIQLQMGLDDARDKPLWAIECLTDPIARRFKYHFSGNRRTNRLDKPEWYFKFILGILQDQSEVIEIKIQQVLDRAGVGGCDAQSRMLRGLIKAVIELFESRIQEILQDEVLFCHTIDQVLAFERQIAQDYNYMLWATPDSSATWPRCIDLFTQYIDQWIQVDYKYASDRLKEVLQHDTAWDKVFSLDQLHATTSSEAVASILQVLQDRFQLLSRPKDRLLFVTKVQKPILHNYCFTMGQIAKDQTIKTNIRCPEDKEFQAFMGIINSCDYLAHVLSELGETMLYLELQQEDQVVDLSIKDAIGAALTAVKENKQIEAVSNAVMGRTAMIGPAAAFSAAFSSVKHVMSGNSDEIEEIKDDSEQEVEDSYLDKALDGLSAPHMLFEPEVDLLENLVQAMIEDASDATMSLIQTDLVRYCRSCVWKSNESCQDPVMSDELGRVLIIVRRILTAVTDQVDSKASRVFSTLILTQLDEYIFDHVIWKQKLSEIGRFQLIHDLKCFRHAMKESFPKCWETIELMKMKPTKVIEILAALEGPDKDSEQSQSLLQACGVNLLTTTQAISILNLRI